MQASNFTWSSSIYAHVGGQRFDLHNDFDFQSISHDLVERRVVLEWKRGSGDWVQKTLPVRLIVTMTGVTEVRMKPRNPSLPFSEDGCLASFGYDSDEDWADGQFWVDVEPDPKWRWSFLFQSGAEIQVAGETASLEVGSCWRLLQARSSLGLRGLARCRLTSSSSRP
jgi:hypothetical protein